MNVRVSVEGLAAFDGVCESRGVPRSVAFREAMTRWMDAGYSSDISRHGYDPDRQAKGSVSHVLSDAEWRDWLWLNDLAAKAYLGGAPVKVGERLDGLRFRLEPVLDPDLEIA